MEDIDILVEYLLKRLSAQLTVATPGISTQALSKIKLYGWPGNIRELQNILKKALIFNRGAPLQPEEITLSEAAQEGRSSDCHNPASEAIRPWIRAMLRAEKQERLFDACLDQVAALLLCEALHVTGGNRSRAAKLLGVSRPTLHAKIDKYNLGTSSETEEELTDHTVKPFANL